MSSTLSVYAVSFDRLQAVIGSGDQGMLDSILAEQADFLATIDDIDDTAEMSCRDALSQLITGDISDDGPGYRYGYALEAICAHVGTELPNICPIARATRWIDEVDTVLGQRNLAVRLCHLVFRGSPVTIPEPDDSPCIGFWSVNEIATAALTIQSLDLSRAPEGHLETIVQIGDWLRSGAKKPDASLVGFLS